MRSRSNWLWAVMAVVFVGCGLARNAAGAPTLVGPASLPVGIDNLSITYSGGTALFNVRFDERSFNDIYGSGTPALTFNTMADVTAAMTAVHAVLQPLPFPTFAGSTPTYDGQGNNSIYYPLVFDDTEVTSEYLLRLQPPQWMNVGLADATVARDAAFDNSDSRAWARFTPVPEPASVVLLALGVAALLGFARNHTRHSRV